MVCGDSLSATCHLPPTLPITPPATYHLRPTIRDVHTASADLFCRSAAFLLVPAVVNCHYRADLEGTHRLHHAERMGRINDGVPVIGQKNPGRQRKSSLLPHPHQCNHQPRVIPFLQLAPRGEQFYCHADVAVIEERAPQPGQAINLCATPCGGNSETRRRVLAGTKSRGPTKQVRTTLAEKKRQDFPLLDFPGAAKLALGGAQRQLPEERTQLPGSMDGGWVYTE